MEYREGSPLSFIHEGLPRHVWGHSLECAGRGPLAVVARPRKSLRQQRKHPSRREAIRNFPYSTPKVYRQICKSANQKSITFVSEGRGFVGRRAKENKSPGGRGIFL